MKNIHVLPTDKPSKMWFNLKGKLVLDTVNCLYEDIQCQNIYITSDDMIEAGNWVIDKGDIVHKFVKYMNYNHYKKIILTTDQNLIKDGVQAIDDEFLEWFVKNSSCEFVKVQTMYFDKVFYKIIIPKEELKQSTKDRILSETPELVKQKVRETANKLVEPKQETLEEAAKRFYTTEDTKRDCNFIEGAKWQQERSYSEEEVFKLVDGAFHMYASSHRHDAKEWLVEQFKKK
jgi:hypothetical protein